MSMVQRGPLTRLETAFKIAIARVWDVVVPYAVIFLSFSFVAGVVVPSVFPEGLAAVASIVLAIFGILLSAALTVGAYAEIVAPSSPVPPTAFSFDLVTSFFDRSWSELRKCIWTFYYVFEYAYFIPLLAAILLFLVFGFVVFSGSEKVMPNQFTSPDGGPVAIFFVVAFIALAIFVVYRQLRSIFAIAHAVMTGKSDRVTFKDSLKQTEGRWWSIFGNFLVVGLVFMGVVIIFTLVVGALFEPFGFPDTVMEFIGSLPSPLFSVFIAFFTYELYKDFVPAEKKVDDIFVP